MKIGIKCEIHTCTLELMKKVLDNFYSIEDVQVIKRAFNSRNISQYSVEKIVSKEDSDYIIGKAPLFFAKSKIILATINEKIINDIREKITKR